MATAIAKYELNAERGNYRELISRIRKDVQEPGRYSHNRPVLPPRHKVGPTTWFELVLTTDNSVGPVTLRIRKDNLYLDGYMFKSANRDDVWYEFKNDTNTNLISGSTFLNFDGSYGGLNGGGAGALLNKRYTRSTVLNAINELAKPGTILANNQRDVAGYLMLMIVVFCEALRFERISTLFADEMQRGTTQGVLIDATLDNLVHGWGDLSEFMLTADANFSGETIRLPEDNKLRPLIGNATQAAVYVGLLLGSKDFRLSNPARALTTSTVPLGQPLMEVLSIGLLVASTRLSGTIIVADGLGSQTLFVGGQQAVNRGDTLTLNPLNRAISAAMLFDISYNLATPASVSGTESWSIFRITDSYARPITGGNASLALSYVIFPDAWQLTWDAKIVASGVGGSNPVNVYGSVTASYTYNGNKYDIVLFSRLAGNSERVAVGGSVPLLRLAGAAPVGVDVTVEVNLLDHVATSSTGRVIVQGRATFRVGTGNAWNGSNVLPFAGTGGGSVTVSAAYSRVSQPPN